MAANEGVSRMVVGRLFKEAHHRHLRLLHVYAIKSLKSKCIDSQCLKIFSTWLTKQVNIYKKEIFQPEKISTNAMRVVCTENCVSRLSREEISFWPASTITNEILTWRGFVVGRWYIASQLRGQHMVKVSSLLHQTVTGKRNWTDLTLFVVLSFKVLSDFVMFTL